jgi:RNase H-fold protein (predicted Holliday junction resolvase)
MHILAIDRWSKKIWLARRSSETKITFPLWFLANNVDTVAHLLHYITEYRIETIVYGKMQQPRLTEQLDRLIKEIKHVYPTMTCVACDEAYSSVQADILLDQQNHPGQDAVAAMYILDTYLTSAWLTENIDNKPL